jgi:hypothetical protein
MSLLQNKSPDAQAGAHPPSPPDGIMKPSQNSARLGIVICIIAAFFSVLQLYYAQWLNSLYYQANGPFYDSMAYLDQLFRTWETSRDQGLIAGLQSSMGGTTCLPFIFIPPFADYVKPSRTLAIALQSSWVFLLYVSLAWFFIRHRRVGIALGLTLPLLFVSIAGIYHYNGGISDFRMDLQMYLCFGLSVVWFLIARSARTIGSWITLGVICGLTCLGRATAPVFLTLTLGPMLLASWFTQHLTFKDVRRAVLYTSAACVSVAGWFYLLNWKHLHYYYFIWNLDANAHLPFSESARHFRYAYSSTGTIIIGAGLLLIIIRTISRWQIPAVESDQKASAAAWFHRVDWAILFPALIPAGFLMMRGAGLNPFVSMPSAFGIVLILVMLSQPWTLTGVKSASAACIIILGALGVAIGGIRSHTTPPPYNKISGYKQAWSIITNHSSEHTSGDIKVTQLGLAYFCGQALLSHLTFDAHFPREKGCILVGDSRYDFSGAKNWGMLAAPAEWAKVPGASDEAKRTSIINLFKKDVSFLIIPTAATSEFLTKHIGHNFINTKLPFLRDQILQDKAWEQAGDEFSVSEQEHYIILRNRNFFAVHTTQRQ